jgi:predicted metal-dependent hydrolase
MLSNSSAKSRNKFKARVKYWADRIDVNPNRILVRPMKNKWASCSTEGSITFSKDLLDQEMDFREYVIVHELLHLQIPNHGRLFKSLLKAYTTDEREIVQNKLVCGLQKASLL